MWTKFSKVSMSKYLFISLGLFVFLFLSFIFIISQYPIPTTLLNFETVRFGRFFSPWPISALEQEQFERKKNKRFSKSERAKRFEKQLQKMNVLTVPIYDLSLDDKVEFSFASPRSYPEKTSYLWPILPKSGRGENEKTVDVFFPGVKWDRVAEGLFLAGGDKIKANIPVTHEKRYLNFSVFPLTPGNIRVFLGQHAWARTFTQEEVQKKISITIPVNDSLADGVRIMSVSSSLYLFDMTVNLVAQNGRIPIKVAENSRLWDLDKQLVMQKNIENYEDPISDDTAFEEEEEEEEEDEASPEGDVKINEETEAQSNLADTNKETEKEKALSNVKQDVVDPLTQETNPQILVKEPYSTAFGYNVVFVQMDGLNEALFNDNKAFAKIAPNIFNFAKKSVFLKSQIGELSENESIFRDTIFLGKHIAQNDTAVVNDILDHDQLQNTYYRFRKFGYKVLSIAPPSAVSFPENETSGASFRGLYSKWLGSDDWIFEEKNTKITDKWSQNAAGLDAIFKTKTREPTPPLNDQDYKRISKYLQRISSFTDDRPNWNPNEYFFVDMKRHYVPKALDAFQTWTAENMQSRFFAHVLLSSQAIPRQPTLNDFKNAILKNGLFSLFHPSQLKQDAYVSYLDRAVAHLLESIKARRMENRTIVVLLVRDGNASLGSLFLKISGLIPKKDFQIDKPSIQDVFATLFSTIGIPSGVNLKRENDFKYGQMLEAQEGETQSLAAVSEKKEFVKYVMLLHSNKKDCAPFIWRTANEAFFGLEATLPVYQVLNSSSIEFFPCAMENTPVRVQWYQKRNKSEAQASNTLINTVGGQFTYQKSPQKFPNFYFGQNLISAQNLVFLFKKVENADLQSIFFVKETELNRAVHLAEESFTLQNKESGSIAEKGGTKVALFLSNL